LAIASRFRDVRQSAAIAEQLDILPKQLRADDVVTEVGAALDRVPLIERSFI
jgi:hypothetical protein